VGKMKKFIALFLVVSFIGMNCATYEKGEGIKLEPGQKPGAKLVIKKKDGQQAMGELIAAKKDSLLLKDSQSGADVSVEVNNIQTITIVMKSKFWEYGVSGFVLGSIFGAVLAKGFHDMDDSYDPKFPFLVIPIFGLILGLPSGLWGSAVGKDKIIQIEGKSDSEIKDRLKELRKKARVPDFQ